MIDWAFIKENLELSDEDLKDSYERHIPTAIKKANIEVGRTLQATDYTLKLCGNGKNFLVLPHYPVNSLELRVDPYREFRDETIIDSSLYDLDPNTGIVTLYSDKFPVEIATIKATFNAGYDPVPEDLKEVLLEIVVWIRGRLYNHGERIGQRDIGVEGMKSSTEMVLPLHVVRSLEKYTE